MPECQNCGGYVSHEWVRVFGDRQGEVHACYDCSSARHRNDGATYDPEYSDDRDTSGNTRLENEMDESR